MFQLGFCRISTYVMLFIIAYVSHDASLQTRTCLQAKLLQTWRVILRKQNPLAVWCDLAVLVALSAHVYPGWPRWVCEHVRETQHSHAQTVQVVRQGRMYSPGTLCGVLVATLRWAPWPLSQDGHIQKEFIRWDKMAIGIPKFSLSAHHAHVAFAGHEGLFVAYFAIITTNGCGTLQDKFSGCII